MIVSSDACFLEFARFRKRELSEGHTHFHSELAHLSNRIEHLFEFRIAVPHSSPRSAHAKTRAPIFPRPPRDRHYVFRAHQPPSFQPRVVARALRAISAVLAASTG